MTRGVIYTYMSKRRVEVPATFNSILMKRVSPEDWETRDKISSYISIGSVVIELPRGLAALLESGSLDLKDFDLCLALKTLGVRPYVVVAHSKTDGRPDCLSFCSDRFSDGFIAGDLPLIPIALLGEE